MYRLKKRLFRLRSFRRKGFGVHSPYTFNLITNVIAVKNKYPVFAELKEQQKQLWERLKEEKEQTNRAKASLKAQGRKSTKIKSSRFICRLIFRLQHHFQAKNPLYISHWLYFPIAYMAKVNEQIQQNAIVENISYNNQLNDFYKQECNINNIHIKTSIEESKQPYDFVVIDDMVSDQLIADFQKNYKQFIAEECILIIGNIYKNSYHKQLWQQLKQDDFFTVRLDYFPVGILIARKGMQVQNYKL